ncbi:zinc-ribbon domain-containing protein [Lachnospiraceae bacterium 62-35]
MFCPKCGAEIKEGSKFCMKCGHRQGGAPNQGAGPGQNPAGQAAYGRNQQAAAMMGKPGGTPPRKNKGLIILLLIILLLLLAGGGGGAYYYFTRDTKTESDRERKDRESHRDEDDEEEDNGDKDSEDRDSENSENDNEEGEEADGGEEESTDGGMESAAGEMPTEPVAMEGDEPVTAQVHYAGEVNLSGMVKAVMLRNTAVDSSHVVQANSRIDNSAWSAFDGQSTTSWQEGAPGDGIGEYIGIGFDREYQVQVITLLLGNHRSDEWYIKNNTPRLLTISLGAASFQVEFPKEKTEFAVALSRPVAASDIRITINGVYQGTEYTDSIISEVGVYGN